ncbi:hypothetical protein RUND412_005490, partial [Rhizina undulata]
WGIGLTFAQGEGGQGRCFVETKEGASWRQRAPPLFDTFFNTANEFYIEGKIDAVNRLNPLRTPLNFLYDIFADWS